MKAELETEKKARLAVEKVRDDLLKQIEDLKQKLLAAEMKILELQNRPPPAAKVETVVETKTIVDNTRIEELEAELRKKDEEIEKLKRQLKEKDAEIARLKKALGEKFADAPDLSGLLAERDRLLAEIEELRKILAELEGKINKLRKELSTSKKSKKERQTVQVEVPKAVKEELEKKGLVDVELPIDWGNVFVRLYQDARQRIVRLHNLQGKIWTTHSSKLLKVLQEIHATVATFKPPALEPIVDADDHCLEMSSDEWDWIPRSLSGLGDSRTRNRSPGICSGRAQAALLARCEHCGYPRPLPAASERRLRTTFAGTSSTPTLPSVARLEQDVPSSVAGPSRGARPSRALTATNPDTAIWRTVLRDQPKLGAT